MRPSNDVIAKAYAAEGSIRGAARALGYAESALRGWANKDPELRGIFMGVGSTDTQTLALASRDAELRNLRREHKQLAEALGKRQEWIAEMREAARVPVEVPSYTVPPSKKLPERSIVLPIFDIQYGQHVVAGDVPFGKGGFSDEIFDERLKSYVTKVLTLLRHREVSTNFTELFIVLGGDLVEGDQIYPGQAWQLEKHPIRQVLDLRTKLGSALKKIIQVAKEELGVKGIAVVCVPGNHGKVGGKRSGATPSDYSWDYLAAELILDDLRAEPVDLVVNEPGGALLFETQGITFLNIHGDEVKGVAGIPFYGLAKADGRLIRMSEVIHDYLLLGHHHQPANIPNGSGGASIVNGDWVGANNLSRQIMAGSRPQQRVLFVSAKHGLVGEEYIYLDGEDRRVRAKPPIYSMGRS